jgi:tRNA synthetases class II (D, K and N)
MAKRPFYTHPDPSRPAFSNGFDLLFRGLELVTGGQRLHRHADYLAALARRGEAAAPYASYLDVFAHGMPPHGGFAIAWNAGPPGLPVPPTSGKPRCSPATCTASAREGDRPRPGRGQPTGAAPGPEIGPLTA